jgi:hypothetical protein
MTIFRNNICILNKKIVALDVVFLRIKWSVPVYNLYTIYFDFIQQFFHNKIEKYTFE